MDRQPVALPAMPGLGPSYRAAALGALRRSRPAAVPAVELRLAAAAIDVDHLAAYDRVCGYRLTDVLPPTYPHVLAFPLAMALMTRRDFPFPLIGLVHVANRIETLAPLRVTDRPDLRVRASALGPHPRGRQLDVVSEAFLDGECVWRERSTYLHRDKAKKIEKTERSEPTPPAGATAKWSVPASVGRRYAKVSGDRNPIHTSRLGARLLGFPRRIAHGMWSAARCLAALEGRLPDAATVEISFQRPLLLPGAATYTSTRTGSGWHLTLADPRTGRTHVTATVTPARAAVAGQE
jgi:acyl dehydratase